MIALCKPYLIGTEHRPLLVKVLRSHLPEEVRIADSWEDIVCFHAVIAIVGSDLKKLGQVLVPHIKVYSYGSLTHTKLVDSHCRIVDESKPAHHASRSTFETADTATHSAHLSEVESHSTTVFAHLRKVVDAPVDAFKRVGDRVNEAARQLMERLARIGEGRGSHRHLQRTEHVVELPYPHHPILRLLQGEVQRNA